MDPSPKTTSNSKKNISQDSVSQDNISENNSSQESISQADIRDICADAYPQLEKFYQKLLSEGEIRGLIGPLEISRLWERHILNSAAVLEAINSYRKQSNKKELQIADVGSGAGFPGIVLAVFLPHDHFTLIEPMERRVQWLYEVCEELQLKNVTIFKGRAEEYKQREQGREREKGSAFPQYFDIVTCRALARLSLLIEWTFPLLCKRGELIALKGKSIPQEVEKAQKVLRTYKAGKPVIYETSIDPRVEHTYVVCISKTAP